MDIYAVMINEEGRGQMFESAYTNVTAANEYAAQVNMRISEEKLQGFTAVVKQIAVRS